MTLWKAAKDTLRTNELRARRGIVQVASCTRCSNACKDLLHVVRDCPFVVELWKCLMCRSLISHFFQLPTTRWFQENLGMDSPQKGVAWCILFGVTIDLVWQQRNALIFNQTTGVSWEVAFSAIRMAAQVQFSMETSFKLSFIRT